MSLQTTASDPMPRTPALWWTTRLPSLLDLVPVNLLPAHALHFSRAGDYQLLSWEVLKMGTRLWILASVIVTLGLMPQIRQADAADLGDRIDDRLDRRGERINERLDRRGDRINERLDRRGDARNERLDRRADRAEEAGRDNLARRLDRKGDRIENRLDRRGDRIENRLDRRGNRVENRLDRRGNRMDRHPGRAGRGRGR